MMMATLIDRETGEISGGRCIGVMARETCSGAYMDDLCKTFMHGLDDNVCLLLKRDSRISHLGRTKDMLSPLCTTIYMEVSQNRSVQDRAI